MKNLGPPPAVPDNPGVESYLRQLYSAISKLDARYYALDKYVSDPTGTGDAGLPVKTDADGKIVLGSSIDHNILQNVATGDVHTQYHNNTRGDARYFQKTEHLNVSAGSGDSGKPIKLNASGKVDKTMITGTQQNHVADASTSHAITDPADAPADADALRDDLVANAIPNIESALNALGTVVNTILVRLETAEINKTS